MAQLLAPTTKPQVSGYKFLVRRAEHALIYADARMIHDPLARLRRSLALGLIGCALFALGAGAMAMFKPQAEPGDAAIVRAESGGLYVRVGETYHPALNLTSARLIAGEPAQPARAADEILATKEFGPPVGIPGAPGVLAAGDAGDESTWSACTRGQGETQVVEGLDNPPAAAPGEFFLARVGRDEYLVTAEGRRKLPAADSAEGATVRRHLGIPMSAGAWEPSAAVLDILPELPSMETLPRVASARLLRAGERVWLDDGEGLAPVTAFQAEVLREVGVAEREVPPETLRGRPLSETAVALPAERGTFVPVHPADTVCVSQRATRLAESRGWGLFASAGTAGVAVDAPVVGVLPPERSLPPGVGIAGTSVATRFSATRSGGMAVTVGDGVVIVGETGTYFPVPVASAPALGVEDATPAPWSVVSLLPRGAALTAEEASSPQL